MIQSYDRRILFPLGMILAAVVAMASHATTNRQPSDGDWSSTIPRSADRPPIAQPEGIKGDNQNPHRGPEETLFAVQNLAPQGFGGQSLGAQGFRGRGRRTADRSEYPTWENSAAFPKDVFTFARIRYTSAGYAMRGRNWDNDYPDCDWNFSVRLHQLTAMKVDPNGVVLELTDDELFDYPFVYFSNVGNMVLSGDEADALGKYLLQGGFMMADDFWAPQGWQNVRYEMKKVFPDREPRELTRDHEIFHLVYDMKTKPQVPSIRAWQRGQTFEYWHGDPQGDEGPHFWGYFDDADRLMALMCHNNDIGDGWEREGENEEYFREYSVRVSYPLGINIVTYAMTH